MKTELYKMSREERLKTIEGMDTCLLFAELDYTICRDMLGMSYDDWLVYEEKKAYQAIINELRERAITVSDEDRSLAEKCFEAHKKAWEKWPFGDIFEIFRDHNGTICVRYEEGTFFRYYFENGNITWG